VRPGHHALAFLVPFQPNPKPVVFKRLTMNSTIQRTRPGFTLVEMMAVTTIIAILAGLVVVGMEFAKQRQATEKAKVQIALLSKAIEEYKVDMGAYPPTSNEAKSSNILFKYLYWDSDDDSEGIDNDEDQKIYLRELDPKNNKLGWTTGTANSDTKIIDPWGSEFHYRSALNSDGEENSECQNPDFDLWSIGKDGKTNTTNPSTTLEENQDDIRNF
jgi:prepilin-type N-terminal cleavage/methylation domain-containing protein